MLKSLKRASLKKEYFLNKTFSILADNQIEIGPLIKNNHGLVLFPGNGNGFGRYGTADTGGYDNIIPEYVGQGDHYLLPLTAAALFGVTQEVHSKGWRVDFGDISSSNGSDPWQFQWVTPANENASRGYHAGHGHLGNRAGLDIDFRYLDINGISFQGTLNNATFDDVKNSTLFQIAFDYGFHSNYATTKANYAGVNPNVGGHLDHGHWGLGSITAEVII